MSRLELFLGGTDWPQDDLTAIKVATPGVVALPNGFVALIWSRFFSDTQEAQWLPPDADLLAAFGTWLSEEAPGT